MKQKCSLCGDEKLTRTDLQKARIKKFGSQEKLDAEYECKRCRGMKRMKAKGKTYDEIGQKYSIDKRKVSKLLNGKC